MKIIKLKIENQFMIIMLSCLMFAGLGKTIAQDIKWLGVSDLQGFVTDIGAEYEGQATTGNANFFSWPVLYGTDQNTTRMRGFWIGCKNFDDPVEGKVKSVKVIGSGPRNASDRPNEIFVTDFKLVGKSYHPKVVVDDQNASPLDNLDMIDSVDENMQADRMIITKFNTSIGISVVKKVSVYTSPNHGSYFINDYVMTNTGIINAKGDKKVQTLHDVFFYWVYRYAFAGVTSSGWGSTWGAFASCWGNSTVNHAFGDNMNAAEFKDPNNPLYQMRGFYSWYGPSKDRTVTYAEDWGCPNESDDGVLGSAKYAGCVTLHADASPQNTADDLSQPKTTWFIGSDITAMSGNVSQYDEVFMSDRYTIMSEGHPDKPHDAYVGDDYAINYTDPRRQSGGGTSQGQGYGPYTLAPGESVHIVFAESVTGIS